MGVKLPERKSALAPRTTRVSPGHQHQIPAQPAPRRTGSPVHQAISRGHPRGRSWRCGSSAIHALDQAVLDPGRLPSGSSEQRVPLHLVALAGHQLVDAGASLRIGPGVPPLPRSRPSRLGDAPITAITSPRLRAIKASHDPTPSSAPSSHCYPAAGRPPHCRTKGTWPFAVIGPPVPPGSPHRLRSAESPHLYPGAGRPGRRARARRPRWWGWPPGPRPSPAVLAASRQRSSTDDPDPAAVVIGVSSWPSACRKTSSIWVARAAPLETNAA